MPPGEAASMGGMSPAGGEYTPRDVPLGADPLSNATDYWRLNIFLRRLSWRNLDLHISEDSAA